MAGDDNSVPESVLFNENAIAILQAVFNSSEKPAPESELPKTASVKFMITLQDEEDLRKLGYSQSQIDKIKPQEAEQILKAGKAR
jgi:hypothetical protein